MMLYFVYAIGNDDMLVAPYDECYIGVTNNLEKRWKAHKRSKYSVGKFIRNNNLSYQKNMKVIFEGNDVDCFIKEEEYRPWAYMGLNEASGGKGGKTVYDEKRNKSISEKVKLSRKNKKWSSHLTRDSYAKSKNPNAKSWILVDPNNNIHYVIGNLGSFCEKHMILETSLKYYLDKKVPNPADNRYGGYRPKSEKSKMMRYNTTGWTLSLASSLPGGVS